MRSATAKVIHAIGPEAASVSSLGSPVTLPPPRLLWAAIGPVVFFPVIHNQFPLEESMYRVFLSHSHVDKPFVRLVAAELRDARLVPWLDELELLPGDSLIVAISKAIADSAYVIAFLSPASVTSAWVEKELAIATSRSIQHKQVIVLPVLLPGLKGENVPPFLSDQVYVDLRSPGTYDAALLQLYRRVLPDGHTEDVELLRVRHVNINAERAEHLVNAANDPANRQWITDYLADRVAGPKRSRDHTERHFAYWALGEIGGPPAATRIQAGLQETDAFARRGAEMAWRKLNRAGI